LLGALKRKEKKKEEEKGPKDLKKKEKGEIGAPRPKAPRRISAPHGCGAFDINWAKFTNEARQEQKNRNNV